MTWFQSLLVKSHPDHLPRGTGGPFVRENEFDISRADIGFLVEVHTVPGAAEGEKVRVGGVYSCFDLKLLGESVDESEGTPPERIVVGRGLHWV